MSEFREWAEAQKDEDLIETYVAKSMHLKQLEGELRVRGIEVELDVIENNTVGGTREAWCRNVRVTRTTTRPAFEYGLTKGVPDGF